MEIMIYKQYSREHLENLKKSCKITIEYGDIEDPLKKYQIVLKNAEFNIEGNFGAIFRPIDLAPIKTEVKCYELTAKAEEIIYSIQGCKKRKKKK